MKNSRIKLKEIIKSTIRSIREEEQAPPEASQGEAAPEAPVKEKNPNEGKINAVAKQAYDKLKEISLEVDVDSPEWEVEDNIKNDVIIGVIIDQLGETIGAVNAVKKLKTFSYYQNVINIIKNETGVDVDKLLDAIFNLN